MILRNNDGIAANALMVKRWLTTTRQTLNLNSTVQRFASFADGVDCFVPGLQDFACCRVE
jgi:hypothetical protein